MFGFIHSSVMEWLIARHVAATIEAPVALSRRPLSPLTVEFLCDLADVRALRAWALLATRPRTTCPGPTPSRSRPGCAPRPGPTCAARTSRARTCPRGTCRRST